MKAVVYYRTRPSEPEASARALLAQKEAVRELFEKCEFRLIREFTEREGEVKGRPAFRAAIRAAAAHTTDGLLDVAFIIPSRAGIGSGEAFTEPRLRGNYRPFCWTLSAILDPALFEIALPGAPAALSLYGDFRWNEPDTRFYLCNAGTEPITEVVVVTDSADWPKPFDYPCRDGEPSGRYTKGPLRNNRFDGRTAGGDRHGGRRPAIHAFSRTSTASRGWWACA